MLTALDKIMAQGAATASKNALVEKALRKELNELRRQGRKTLWQETPKDPLFIKDVEEAGARLWYADAETVGKYGSMTNLQWAVIEANLNPVVGAEQNGICPVLQ